MSTIIYFPININYQVYGIHRDGRVIVRIINSSRRFIMPAKDIVANRYLIKNFPKNQVKWLCDLAAHDTKMAGEQIQII